MTEPEQTERLSIEAYAVELGWSIYRTTGGTSFGYEARRVIVYWSPDGYAEQAEVARVDDGTVLVAWHKNPADVPGVVGRWVRQQLDVWLISYWREGAGRRAAGGES